MEKELELKLKEKYPQLFQDLYGDPTKTCMAWGCTCGKGWYNLIDETCAKIQEELNVNPDPDFRFLQVKEKFAALRIYYQGGNQKIKQIISNAEEESMKICEVCGSRDDVCTSGNYWINSLCQKCRQEKAIVADV